MNTPNIVWILIFYVVGFIAGYLSQKDKVAKRIENAKKEIFHALNPDAVGAVERPSAQKLAEMNDPHTKIIKDTKDAMKETLDKLIKI